MIEIRDSRFHFCFPDVHRDAGCYVAIMTTVSVPDDGHAYPLASALANLAIGKRGDLSAMAPAEPGGGHEFLMPILGTGAMCFYFGLGPDPGGFNRYDREYPCAVKIGLGGINVLTGGPLVEDIQSEPQDYLVVPDEPWLNGFPIGDGVARQFLRQRPGAFTAGDERRGAVWAPADMELLVYPMRTESYELRRRRPKHRLKAAFRDRGCGSEMELGSGGRIRERLYTDPYGFRYWDLAHVARCRITFLDAVDWLSLAGAWPEDEAMNFDDYLVSGLGWFELCDPPPNTGTARRKLRYYKELEFDRR